jgi:hypothetical protein
VLNLLINLINSVNIGFCQYDLALYSIFYSIYIFTIWPNSDTIGLYRHLSIFNNFENLHTNLHTFKPRHLLQKTNGYFYYNKRINGKLVLSIYVRVAFDYLVLGAFLTCFYVYNFVFLVQLCASYLFFLRRVFYVLAMIWFVYLRVYFIWLTLNINLT